MVYLPTCIRLNFFWDQLVGLKKKTIHLGKLAATPREFNSAFTPEKMGGWKTRLTYWVSGTVQGKTLLNFGWGT